MVESCPQLNGTIVQQVEVIPNKIETIPNFLVVRAWRLAAKFGTESLRIKSFLKKFSFNL